MKYTKLDLYGPFIWALLISACSLMFSNSNNFFELFFYTSVGGHIGVFLRDYFYKAKE